MANRFWVGGTGNWSDNVNHWSDTSGGSPGASKPTSADNVYFDENSFTDAGQTVTINEAANCLDMDWTGALYSPTLAGNQGLSIYGAITLINEMTLSFNYDVLFLANTTVDIITAGKTFKRNVTFNGNGGVFNLRNNFIQENLSRSLTVTAGTLNTNNFSINCNNFNSNNNNVREINLGSSIIVATGNIDFTTTTNLTFDAGTSTFIMTGNAKFFNGGGLTYHNVRFSGTPTTVTGANTFNTLTVDPGKTCTLPASTTQTASALEWDGATIQSSSAGTAATVSVASGTVEMNWGSLKDIAAEGGATFNAVNVTNVSGNDGWNWSITKNKIPMSMGMGM
jgi:hypothetical protein